MATIVTNFVTNTVTCIYSRCDNTLIINEILFQNCYKTGKGYRVVNRLKQIDAQMQAWLASQYRRKAGAGNKSEQTGTNTCLPQQAVKYMKTTKMSAPKLLIFRTFAAHFLRKSLEE